jgi:hypothetical protein
MTEMTIEEAKAEVEKMRTPLDMGRLWCVWVMGPDTIIAQPTRRLAEARAALWQESIDRRFIQDPPTEYDPCVYCVVKPWEGSADSHAENLARHRGEPGDIC